ncbi:secretion activator protein [Burkholderia pseudomallei]|nr:secretion activator protein [Burkholderia pseudomallei]
MSGFDDAFIALVGNEGGYVDNPKDPGGATRWGITERVARASGYAGPMRDLPLETAKAIAKRLYWDPLHCDEYDPRIAFQLLDANYNGGHVVLWMQQATNVKADGILGPQTIAAVAQADPFRFVMRFIAFRQNYLTACKPWPTFGRGWIHRMSSNLIKGAS